MINVALTHYHTPDRPTGTEEHTQWTRMPTAPRIGDTLCVALSEEPDDTIILRVRNVCWVDDDTTIGMPDHPCWHAEVTLGA